LLDKHNYRSVVTNRGF